MFKRTPYSELNSRQKENYNFQKVAGLLADYGFNCLRLTDDWQGADFIACHINGSTYLKIQLKGRLVIDRKYEGKDIYIAFFDGDECFVYPHDDFIQHAVKLGSIEGSKSWDDVGSYSWPSPPKWAAAFLANWGI